VSVAEKTDESVIPKLIVANPVGDTVTEYVPVAGSVFRGISQTPGVA
jgi:hypothetical protein